MTARLLVAGVGNVFLGDDGFGVEAVRRLATREFPDWVRLADYGIRGMHLAYDLVSGEYATTVLVDAAARGERPGTVSVVELDPPDQPDDTATVLDAHGMQRTWCSGWCRCSAATRAGCCWSAASPPCWTRARG